MEGTSQDFSMSEISIGTTPSIETSVLDKQEVPSKEKEAIPPLDLQPVKKVPVKVKPASPTPIPSTSDLIESPIVQSTVDIKPEESSNVVDKKPDSEPQEELVVTDLSTTILTQGDLEINYEEMRSSAPIVQNYGMLYLVLSVCLLASVTILLYRHCSSQKV